MLDSLRKLDRTAVDQLGGPTQRNVFTLLRREHPHAQPPTGHLDTPAVGHLITTPMAKSECRGRSSGSARESLTDTPLVYPHTDTADPVMQQRFLWNHELNVRTLLGQRPDLRRLRKVKTIELGVTRKHSDDVRISEINSEPRPRDA